MFYSFIMVFNVLPHGNVIESLTAAQLRLFVSVCLRTDVRCHAFQLAFCWSWFLIV